MPQILNIKFSGGVYYMMTKTWDYLSKTMVRGTRYSETNITFASWATLAGHPIYWVIWTYLLPQPHDSVLLRFGSALLSIGLILRNRWPISFKKYIPFYWHVFLFIILPVTFTFLALKNNFNFVWTLCHLGMIFLMILLIIELIWFWILLILGSIAGTILFVLDGGTLAVLDINIEYIPVMLFALVICIPFMHLALRESKLIERKVNTEKHRAEMFQALSGSIAHEVRNPVSAGKQCIINLEIGVEILQQALKELDMAKIEKRIAMFKNSTRSAYEVLNRGDVVISMILKNIREEKIDPAQFKELTINPIITDALKAYPFQDRETDIVQHEAGEDFHILGDKDLLVFVLFNLIKNALYYLPAEGGKITITPQQGEQENRLHIKDNGAGISLQQLPHIFDNFASYNTVGGTGLGLPFCKRVMTAMGGDITCKSKQGQGAEFILHFPLCNQKLT
ncbi:MAG: HAMP domain-containing histidine kinase [Gammaproteobacteria bacterium]|nr:HAMP domain-containing histidine kinase [Gammaproteobacteria bacterium]MDH5652972.1 HAMP domain-containing histidine kinase [Gammaproteobacteria bacterium]